MKHLTTEVLVIGGGATGTGLVRDLALRGFQTILVEKNDLSTGTTGRYHGLLHSGGRYVVNDPPAAIECIQENQILKKIIPFAIEDTGGFFVVTPWDDPDYADLFLTGCHKSGIPVEEISPGQLFAIEPNINRDITRCFRLPDASADSFLTSQANAQAAATLGAQILTYHPVVTLLMKHDAIVGAVCVDLKNDEQVTIYADIIINASGAWAGKIAEKAGIKVRMIPGKGTMLALNHRVVNTVINRCKYPSDGDIIVPAHSVAILGTTDHPVPDPDVYSIEEWEIKKIIEEGQKIIPGLKQLRFLRAWAGVRPLYKESDTDDTRAITRAFVLLDHEQRDGVTGFITITCGKWTTYRKMAEVTVDLVCQKLHTSRLCRTHQDALENPAQSLNKIKQSEGTHKFHFLGARLKEIEEDRSASDLLCECELVTKNNVVDSIIRGKATTIDDIRRQTRLGMGPCQGGFCTIRAAGILHETSDQPVLRSNQLLIDFIEERWKGVRPVLWGEQLKQAQFDDFIFKCILNLDQLPLHQDQTSKPGRKMHQSKKTTSQTIDSSVKKNGSGYAQSIANGRKSFTHEYDIIIVGAGLSGLIAAWRIAKRGLHVGVISKGWGALYWNTGCVDILGYSFHKDNSTIDSPLEYLKSIHQDGATSNHPYAKVALNCIEDAVDEFKALCSSYGYPMHGSLSSNVTLPGALGIHRPTCLFPKTMAAGIPGYANKMIVIGFANYPDFFPKLVSDNLRVNGIEAYPLVLSTREYSQEKNITDRRLSQWFTRPDFRYFFANSVKKEIKNITNTSSLKIGMPAVLGDTASLETFDLVQQEIGVDIFEIPTLPPSIPGIRLCNMLLQEIKTFGGQVWIGHKAISADIEKNNVIRIWTEAASGYSPHQAKKFILASGGVLGGGIHFPYEHAPREIVFDLPVNTEPPANNSPEKPILPRPTEFTAGILVNHQFQPVDEVGNLVYENVYCVGTGLYGGDFIMERSFDGVGLVTGFSVGENIV